MNNIRLTRQFTEPMLEKFYGWRNDERIYKWCRQVGEITYVTHENYWEMVMSGEQRDVMFAVIDDDAQKLVGCCGLTSLDSLNRRAEFSLYIGPEFHRMGFAKSALNKLFRIGFKDYGLNCIWGETFEGNPASSMFERFGMEKEGTRRGFYFRDGKFIDCHIYSMLSADFDSLSARQSHPVKGVADVIPLEIFREGRNPETE